MGHALVLEKELRPLPADFHPYMGFVSLVNTHGLWDENIVYIDLSPFVNLSLCLPTNAAGVSAIHNAHLLKSPFLAEYVGRLTGLRGLVLLEGKEWKDMRTMFNPGFSAKETMARLSDMVDEGDIFVELLAKIANGEGFVADMDDMAKHVTFDIIMQATLGVKSHSQTTFHELNDLIRVMGTLPGDATSLNPLHQVNFIKFGKQRYYEWRIKKWLTPVMLARWEEIKQGKGEGRKYILDLALEKRLEERTAAGLKPGTLDADYVDLLADM
jgi:cytochrome P450